LLLDGSGSLLKTVNYPRGAFFRHITLADPASSDFLLIVQRPNSLKLVMLRYSKDGVLKGSKSISITPIRLLHGAAINPGRNEIVLLLGNSPDLYAYRLNFSLQVLSQSKVASFRSGDLGSSSVTYLNGKYWVAYSREEKLYVRLLGSLGKPISTETFVDDILDFSFRKILIPDPAGERVLLVWETSKATGSFDQVRHIYAHFLSSKQ
jgi:hypothetical protein